MTESRSTDTRVELAGSYRRAAPADDLGGRLAADSLLEVTLVLRRRAEPTDDAFTGPPLTRDELAQRYGADPGELAAVAEAVTSAGAEVVWSDAASRRVRVRGDVATMSAMFGTTLSAAAEGATGTRRRQGSLALPAALSTPLVAVLGLDDRAQADTRLRRAASSTATGFTPLQLALAYDFPAGDGTGQTIAIVELGGGFGQDDLNTYFGGLGVDVPSVRAVPVDGGENVPGQAPDGADGEVLLDIEVAGAIAPKADILVYFAPNTDDGFVDAISQAAHASPAPTAISISWGQSEDQWTAQGRSAMDSAIADAVLLGATVTVAAGDNGSSDTPAGSASAGPSARGTSAATAGPHVDFPASSPHALGCGGTSLTLDSSGAVASETVWNDGASGGSTGGGVSDEFAVPSWQAKAGVPPRDIASGKAGRGVPDVAAVADPETGYRVVVDGSPAVIGGTSAVAPLMAGLVARLAQAAGKPIGLLQPMIYTGAAAGRTAPGFRDITQGSNGEYSATAGWDPCSGLGVPVGTHLAAVLGIDTASGS